MVLTLDLYHLLSLFLRSQNCLNYYYVIKVTHAGTKASTSALQETFNTANLSLPLTLLTRNCSYYFCCEEPILKLVKQVANALHFFDYVFGIRHTS